MYVKFDLKVLIFTFLFFISGNIKNYLLLMLFAILHELGHIVVGCILGLKIEKVEIMPIGLRANFKINIADYNKKVKRANLLTIKKLILSLAGPIVNLIFIILFIFLGKNNILGIETEILIYINLIIFLFNMLLIYPLDGGRILKYVLYCFLGKEKSLKFTNIISNIFAIFTTLLTLYIIAITKNILYIFILIYIWIIVIRENRVYNIKAKIYKILKNNIAINKD